MTRLVLILVLACALLGVYPVALAQQRASSPGDTATQVESLAAEARQLVADGNFVRAISRYLQAHQLQPNAAILYNVAFIYDRKMGDSKLAVAFYRRYLAADDAQAEVVERALQRLQQLEGTRGSVGATLEPLPIGRDEAPTPMAPAETVTEISAGEGTGWGLTGWLLTGASVLTGGVGLAYGVMAQRSEDKFDKVADESKLELRERGQDQAQTADILLGVSAACLVTGLIVFALEPDGEPESAALGAGIAPTRGGLVVSALARW